MDVLCERALQIVGVESGMVVAGQLHAQLPSLWSERVHLLPYAPVLHALLVSAAQRVSRQAMRGTVHALQSRAPR